MESQSLTILIVTSPTPTNPSTSLVDHVLESFTKVPSLSECPKIIICDGYILNEKERLKKGKVSQERAEAYEQYKINLQNNIDEGKLIYYQNTQVLPLPERVGFGFAIKKAMGLIKTKKLMVVQHDRCFLKEFDLKGVINSMDQFPHMKFVLLPIASTYNYKQRMDSKFKTKNLIKGMEITTDAGLTFLPLLQFYDSTHIATVEFYTDFIFKYRFVPSSGFIEDKLGQIQVGDIRKNGVKVHAKYGTYLYGDGFERVIQHLDGRDSLTSDEFTWDFNTVDGFKRIMHNAPLYSAEEIYRRETMEQSTYEIPDGGLCFFEDLGL